MPIYATEVHEGETEDIWANEVYVNGLLQKQQQCEEALQLAYIRKDGAKNPITRLAARVSIGARARRLEEAEQLAIQARQELPLPAYWNENE